MMKSYSIASSFKKRYINSLNKHLYSFFKLSMNTIANSDLKDFSPMMVKRRKLPIC